MISVRNVSKIWSSKGTKLAALKGITFDVPAGQFVSILGPSGCGKSTLLRIIAGLVAQSSGSAKIGSKKSSAVGMIFQKPVLLPWKTVYENVALPLKLKKEDCRLQVNKILDVVGLSRFRDYFPSELSGGMQQRAAIARALVLNPEYLLMDEPFSALDEISRKKMNIYLKDLCGRIGITVLFVTHSIEEAVFLSDRVIVLSKRPGCVVFEKEVMFKIRRDEDLFFTEEFRGYARCLRESLS